MVMLNVGILALVAGFNSGAVTLARTSKVANATVIADTFLERYRGYKNCEIYLDRSAPGGIPTTGTYANDAAYNATQFNDGSAINGSVPATCSLRGAGASWPFSYTAGQQAAVTAHNASYAGPDRRAYVVDVYIVSVNVSGGGNQKQVTVVVRDPASSTTYTRESSTFDPFDGCLPNAAPPNSC
jgi:type II secretory pathway pseudopilin PulG